MCVYLDITPCRICYCCVKKGILLSFQQTFTYPYLSTRGHYDNSRRLAYFSRQYKTASLSNSSFSCEYEVNILVFAFKMCLFNYQTLNINDENDIHANPFNEELINNFVTVQLNIGT